MSKSFWWTTEIKKNYSFLEKLYYVLEKFYLVDEVWNKKLEEKFEEALRITKESKIGDDDESKVEEVFKTPVFEKYSREKFSLKETERIIDLIKEGINKCNELDEDLYYEIKDFKKIYDVYNYCYKSLNSNYTIK